MSSFQNIATIEFDLRSRDEIPTLLMGLRHIYCTTELREEIFKILEGIVPKDVDNKKVVPEWSYGKYLCEGHCD